jgi:HEAT repeat protein
MTMDAAQRTRQASRRTPNDVSALCVELLRAVREQEFRARFGSGPAPSVDRAWRAWRGDLDRYGPLHLVADAQGVREGETGLPVGRGRLDDLAERLRARVPASVRFEPGLDAPTYAAFVSLLVAAPEEVERHGGAAGFLPEHGVGIQLLEPEDEADKPEDAADASGAEGADATGADGAEPTPEPAPVPGPPATAAAETAAPARTHASRPVDDPLNEETLRLEPNETLLPVEEAERALEEAPAARGPAPAGDDRARVDRLLAEAGAAKDADDREACYAAVLELAALAEERGAAEPMARRAALGALRELCTGRVLLDVIDHATAEDRQAALRASRVLVRVAEQVGPTLLSAIDAEKDASRREELLGIAIALGRSTTPALHRAMEGNSTSRARIAARIVGEIRDDRAVPTLSRLLEHTSPEVRGESARALARIGNVAALTTLKRGLESSHEDVSSLCAYCLGVTGSPDAARALTETLRQARRARRTQLASAVIRSLGRLGREESVPELKRVIEKRSLFHRQELRELKLQAIGALSHLAGERSRGVLEAVAAGSDMGLAVAARRALNEMAEAAASGAKPAPDAGSDPASDPGDEGHPGST